MPESFGALVSWSCDLLVLWLPLPQSLVFAGGPAGPLGVGRFWTDSSFCGTGVCQP